MGIATAVCVTSLGVAQEKDPRALVADANQAIADGDYAPAIEIYREVEVMLPQSAVPVYNQGVAYYRLRDYPRARAAFSRSLSTAGLGLEAKVKFNLGNVAYASALEETANPQKAIGHLKSAIGHFRDAIELDPGDQDAYANIEISYLLMKDLLKRLRQQRKEQPPQQDGQRDEPESEPGPSPGQQDEEQKTDPEQQRRPQQQEGEEITAREAESLLQAVRDKEQQRRQERARRQQARRTPVTKDW